MLNDSLEDQLSVGSFVRREQLYESDNIQFIGMSKNSETTYEIWVHEDCVIWSPDVYLVGPRITGLDAAVWNSLRYYCAICGNTGAMLCCLERQCKAPAHIPCARQSQWYFNDKEWQVHCEDHLPNHVINQATSMSVLHSLTTTASSEAYS